jgi:flagellum-specific peptidoglycan hydrolase FlgJ
MRSKIMDRVFICVLCVILILTLGMSFQTSNKLSANSPSYSSMMNYPTGLIMQVPLTQQPTTISNPAEPIPAFDNSQEPPSPERALEKTPSEEAAIPENRVNTYEVTAFYLNVRSNPNSKSNIVNVVKKGDLLEVVQITDNGWLELKNGRYVHGGYAKIISGTALPDIAFSVEEHSEPAKPTSTVQSDSGLTEDHIAAIFDGTELANNELEEVILEVEEEYGINAYFTIAVMKLESGNGSSRLAKNKNNLFGLNAIDGDKNNKAFSFKTKGDSIRKFGQLLAKNYVGKGYTTIEKVARKYCPANTKWSGIVKTIMNRDYYKL